MWISDRHPDRQQLLDRQARSQVGPEPPEPGGENLAAIPRRSRDKPDQELRVILSEYEGHPYVMIQLWELGKTGYWPVKGRSVSVRIKELADIASALGRAEDALVDREHQAEADRQAAPPMPRERRSSAPPKGRRRPSTGLPLITGSTEDVGDVGY